MNAVPCHQKFAAVIGRDGQMQSVAGRVFGHEPVGNVVLNNRLDFRRFSQQRQGLQHRQAFGALVRGITGIFQFLNHGVAGHEGLFMGELVPPFLRPALAGKIGGIFPGVEVETRNRGFNVNFIGHFISAWASAESEPVFWISKTEMARESVSKLLPNLTAVVFGFHASAHGSAANL